LSVSLAPTSFPASPLRADCAMATSRLMHVVAIFAVTTPWSALSEPDMRMAHEEEASAVTTTVVTNTKAEAPAKATVEAVAEATVGVASTTAANETAEALSSAAANGTEPAMPGHVPAAPAVPTRPSGNLRGTLGQGRAIFRDTCCMCSMQSEGHTVLYAAGDYTQSLGAHAANTWCQQGCEAKCHRRGGHMFGCYDEQQLSKMDRMYRQQTGYQILRDQEFGNIC